MASRHSSILVGLLVILLGGLSLQVLAIVGLISGIGNKGALATSGVGLIIVSVVGLGYAYLRRGSIDPHSTRGGA